LLPNPFGAQCTQAIADNGPQIIQDILNAESPQVICTQLGLCSSRVNPAALQYVREHRARLLAHKKVNVKAKGPDCSICVFVVGQVEDMIASNATETQIEDALNQACALLGSFQAQCQALVAQLPAYIAQLEKAEDPTTICTQVGLCTAKPKAARFPLRHN